MDDAGRAHLDLHPRGARLDRLGPGPSRSRHAAALRAFSAHGRAAAAWGGGATEVRRAAAAGWLREAGQS